MEEQTVDQDPIATCFETLAAYLTTSWARMRTPNGFEKALQQVRSEATTSTGRIFLEAGFQAWVAYFLATNHEGRHHQGQGAKRQAIVHLQTLSTEHKQQIATSLAELQAHPSVNAALEDLGTRNSKRRRLSTRSPPPVDAQYTAVPDTQREAPSSESRATFDSRDQEQTLTGATIHGIVSIFPQWTVRAIQKEDTKVAATMVFPANPHNGRVMCLMSLAIYPERVQRLASVLFGVHVETQDGVQCVVYNNIVRVVPRPEIALQGATEEAIIEYLGSEVHCAIEASPIRIEEKKDGIQATNCVTMIFTSNPMDVSILSLNLALEGASKIADRLYG